MEQVADIKLGRTPARERRDYWEHGAVPWVAIADLDGGTVSQTRERISQHAHQEVFKGELVPPGTILLSFKLTIGKVGILGLPAVHNEAIASLTLRDAGVDRDFLVYALQTLDYSEYLDTYVKGRTLNKDKLKSLRLVLPPLPEQRAIARLLHTVQDTIHARRRELALERERKAALMQHLFTRGSRGEPTKLTEIGEMPQTWHVVILSSLANVRYGLGQPPDLDDSGVPMIRATDIKAGTIVGDAVLRVRRGAIPLERNPFLRTGDIIVVRSGAYAGDVAMYDGRWEVAIAGYDLVVSPNRGSLEPGFLAGWLLAPRVQSYFRSQRTRSAQPHLNAQQLSETSVPIPSLDEQREIAEVLVAVDKRAGALQREARIQEELFRALLEELMTGRLSALPLVAAEAGVPA